jgi:aminobenzoyl-glutamate transport protein
MSHVAGGADRASPTLAATSPPEQNGGPRERRACKWAIFATVFIPLFIRLEVAPQTLLAAYRLGDSPMNVITPLMVYIPFIVLVAQRHKSNAGLGTVVSLMIPYTFVVLVAWLIFFILWFLLGIPMGPGYPARL